MLQRHPGGLADRARSGPDRTLGLPLRDRRRVAAPRPARARRSPPRLNRDYLRALGADPDALGIRYDVLPRPGRPPIPLAFTLGMGGWAADQRDVTGPWTPRPPWVFATYETGGLGNLVELLHESGHAIHAAAIRTRPAFLESTEADTAYLEGVADVLGWDADRAGLAASMAGRGRHDRRGRPRPVWRGDARHLLGAVRDRAASPARSPTERRLDRDHGRRPGHRAAPRMVVVGAARPAHRRPRLHGQLRPGGPHRGGGPDADPRGPRPVVGGRPGLVRLRGRRAARRPARRARPRTCSRPSSAGR